MNADRWATQRDRTSFEAVLPSAAIRADLPMTSAAQARVQRFRSEVDAVLNFEDDRLLVVIGPCSTHDIPASIAYAARLRALAEELHDDLMIVIRAYFEKPRTTLGWAGLISDPGMNGGFEVERGIRIARGLLLELNELGLATATEWLNPIASDYIADLVSYGAIGAPSRAQPIDSLRAHYQCRSE